PYVAKAANGWLTTMIIQNLGAAPATVTATFAAAAGTTRLTRYIAQGRSSAIDPTVEPALIAGVYSVTLTADQPIATVVNAHNDAPGVAQPMGFSYNGVPADSSSRVLVPYVVEFPALGGRRTGLYIQNAGLSSAAPNLVFRTVGLAGPQSRVVLPSLAPGTAA